MLGWEGRYNRGGRFGFVVKQTKSSNSKSAAYDFFIVTRLVLPFALNTMWCLPDEAALCQAGVNVGECQR
jgi:hypothetical protein